MQSVDAVSEVALWFWKIAATWYIAALMGSVLIVVLERRAHRAEASDDDVRRAADRYRRRYGKDVHEVIGEHMRAACYAPIGQHRRFLKRVAIELLANDGPEGCRTGPDATGAGAPSVGEH